MLSNYLKIIFRNLKHQKIYSFINILGLAVGITCFIVLSLFVLDEFGYDEYNEKADRIYRVCVYSLVKGQESCNSKTPGPLGSTLQRDFPEVVSTARIGYSGQFNFRYGNKFFREYEVYTADSTFFDIFTLPMIYGDPKIALTKPNSIILTRSSSKKYFGNENPLGKIISANDNQSFIVTGVMEDFPKKSHFSCGFLLSMSTYPITERQNWLDLWYTTYILFKEGTDTKQFENKLQNTVLKYVGPQVEAISQINLKEFLESGNKYRYFIQPLKSIYLYSQSEYGIDSNTEWGQVRNSNIVYSYALSAIAIFILLIAVFNFMNLATARAEKRIKEVGIRKTLGSDRWNLIKQFITESIFTCFISVLVAIGFTKLVLPIFNDFVSKNLELELFKNAYTLPLLIVFTIITGTLSGSYPAFYLSSFQPSHILKSNAGKGSRRRNLRSLLVIIQFAISITLIIGTIIIKNQLSYIREKDLGFRKEQLIVINNGSTLGNKLETFKQEISENPGVIISTSSSIMFDWGIPGSGYLFDKRTGSDIITTQFLDVDYNFAKTYGVELKYGRFFSKDFSTDSSAVVMNEAAAKECKSGNFLGKYLYKLDVFNGNQPFKIIGVVKDFNYESLHQNIRPLVFHLSPVRQASTYITIRIKPYGIQNTIDQIEKVWHKYAGNEYFYCTFVDENLAKMYEAEERMGNITTVFSLLAIIIACMGLFGLAAFVTELRVKEIGIRKTLGASVIQIIIILSMEFTKWVILANLISWPVAYYIMNTWLNNFAYRIELGFGVFILSAFLALFIALFTVGVNTVKAATANPVDSLKYE